MQTPLADSAACRIDHLELLAAERPKSVPEVGELVRGAGEADRAIYPFGGRTQLEFGLPPCKPGIGVDLRGLDGVVDYPARDMTVTVQAGITLARLQALLARERQRLPVDVPLAERATLGGALATNTSGPRRYGFGTLRDYVIGIRAVNGAGQEFKAGGRVVKNVAGYDLCKLLIGSLGTLGIITQVTLKLTPRPEEQAFLLVGCQTAAIASLLDCVHASRTRPVCVDLLNRAALQEMPVPDVPAAGWLLAIAFEDNAQAVEWQLQQLHRELSSGECGPVSVVRGQPVEQLWKALTEFQLAPRAHLAFKANLLPRLVAEFCSKAGEAGMALQAHAGSGIVRGLFTEAVTMGQAQRALLPLLEAAAAGQGNLVLPRCPADWKSSLPLWGSPRGDHPLLRAIKEKLDPGDRFNPGRFVDAL